MGVTYGYARVSSRDQNLDRQMRALAALGVPPERIFAEKASGKDFERPVWRHLMRILIAGDVLAVKSIDRLGRSYDEILEHWRTLTKEMRVHVVVIDMPLLDTRAGIDGLTGTLIADVVLQLLSYVAQMERDNTRQRQAEGIAAARARGVRLGRPPKRPPDAFPEVKELLATGELSCREAARRLGVSVGTLCKWMREGAA